MASSFKVNSNIAQRGSRSTSRGGGNRAKAASSAEKYKIGTTLTATGKA